jgi:NADH:ubiquinone oxidoreductase subunit 3 (subunit A)
MLKSYFPVVIFILLGAGVGTAFTLLNNVLGPIQLKALGTFALVETIVFIVLLLVGFVFVWRRGALEWR